MWAEILSCLTVSPGPRPGPDQKKHLINIADLVDGC